MTNFCYRHSRKWEPLSEGRGLACPDCETEKPTRKPIKEKVKIIGDKNEVPKVWGGEREVHGEEKKG